MASITPPGSVGSTAATTAATALAPVVSIGNPGAIEALEAARVNLGRPVPAVPVAGPTNTLFSPNVPSLAATASAVPHPLAAHTGIPEPAATIGSPLALAARAEPIRAQLIELYPWARRPTADRLAASLSTVAELAGRTIDVQNSQLVRTAALAIRDVVAAATFSVVQDRDEVADLLVRSVTYWVAVMQLNIGISHGRVQGNSLDVHPWRGSGQVFRTYGAILATRGVREALHLLNQIGIDRLFEVVTSPAWSAFRTELDDAQLLMEGALGTQDVVRRGLPLAKGVGKTGQTVGGEIEVVAPGKSRDDVARAIARGLQAAGYEVELVGEGATVFFEFDRETDPTIFLKEYWRFQRGDIHTGLELLRGTASTMIRSQRFNSQWQLVKTESDEAKQHIKDPKKGEDSLEPARIQGAGIVAGYLGMGAETLQDLVHNRVVGKVDVDLEKNAGVVIEAKYLLMIKGGEDIAWIFVEFLPNGEAKATGENAFFNAPGRSEDKEYRFSASNIEEAKAHLVAVAQRHPGFLRKSSPISKIIVRKDGRRVGEVELRYEEHPAYEAVTSPLTPDDYQMVLAVAAGLAEVSHGTSEHDAFGIHVHAGVDSMTGALNVIKAYVRRRKAMLRFLNPEKGRKFFMAEYTAEYMGRMLEEGYLMDLGQYTMPDGMSVAEMQVLVGVADYVTGARPKYSEVNAEPFFDYVLRRLFGAGKLKDGQVISFDYRGRRYVFTPHLEDMEHAKGGVKVVVEGVREKVRDKVDWATDELVRSPRTTPIPTLELRVPDTSEADGRIDPQTVLENLQIWASFVAENRGSPSN